MDFSLGIVSALSERPGGVGEVVPQNLKGIPTDFLRDLNFFYTGDTLSGNTTHNSSGSIRDGVLLGSKVSIGLARELFKETSGFIKCSAGVVRESSRLAPRRAQSFLEFFIQPVVVFVYADFQLSGDQGRILT